MSSMEMEKNDDGGIEAIIVEQVGSQVVQDPVYGKTVLVQAKAVDEQVYTFALSPDAAQALAEQLIKQIGE